MNLKKLLYIDRRIIYLVVAIGALFPIIRPIGLPVVPTEPVIGLFEKLESLSPGDAVIISYDYGPSSEPELNPMSAAILRHRSLSALVPSLKSWSLFTWAMLFSISSADQPRLWATKGNWGKVKPNSPKNIIIWPATA